MATTYSRLVELPVGEPQVYGFSDLADLRRQVTAQIGVGDEEVKLLDAAGTRLSDNRQRVPQAIRAVTIPPWGGK